jgi:hypothetical protein
MNDGELREVRGIVADALRPYCFPVSAERSKELADFKVGDVLKAGQAPNTSRVIIVDSSLEVTGPRGSVFWANPNEVRYSAYSDTSKIDVMKSDKQPGQGWAYSQWRTITSMPSMFELAWTLTPQSDDITNDLIRRLRDATDIPDTVLAVLLPSFGIPWPPARVPFSSLHELSQDATKAITTYSSDHIDQKWNFISLDFIDETDVMSVVKRRCGVR